MEQAGVLRPSRSRRWAPLRSESVHAERRLAEARLDGAPDHAGEEHGLPDQR